MTTEEFQRIAKEHGGLNGAPVVLNPTVKKKDRYGEESEVPNPTPKYRYVFNDGATIEAITQPNGELQVTDPGNALKPPSKDKDTPAVRTFPDGSERQYNPQTGNWDVIATKPKEPTVTRPTTGKGPEGQDLPGTRTISATQAQDERDIERIKVEQQNAQTSVGRLDLDRVRQAAEAKLQQLNADVAAGRLSLEARAQQWKEYKEQNIDAPVRQAQIEAERARTAATAQNAATTAAGQALKEREYEEVTKPQAALTSGLAVAKFGRDAGQDAVSNWLKTAPLMVGDSFGANFSNALNTLSSGGGPVHFGANDFTYQIPNLDALAEEGARRAISMLKGGLGSLGAAVQAPPAVAPAPAPSPAVQPAPFPNSPDPRAVAAMNDPQVLAWLTTHGSGA